MTDGMAEIAVAKLTPEYIGGRFEVTNKGVKVGFQLASYEVRPVRDGKPQWHLITDRGVRIEIEDPDETMLRWPHRPATPQRPTGHYPATGQAAPATPAQQGGGWYRTQPQ